MPNLLLLILGVVLAGCSTAAVQPIYLECKGKAVITGTGHGAAGMADNAFSITADCADTGFSLTKAAAPPAAK